MESERTVSRFTFEATAFLAVVTATVIEGILIAIVSRQLGLSKEPSGEVVSGLIMVNILISRAVVDRAYKALGLSRSGRMVEARRPAAMAPGYTPAEDAIEIQYPRLLFNVVPLTFLGFAGVTFLLTEVIIPRQDQERREFLPLLYGVLLGLAALTYFMRYIVIIRIDARGVTAARTPYSIRPTTIPWSRIASCDLVVIRDTFGKITVAYPVMKDVEGRDLFRGLSGGLAMASADDQQKVLRYLKGRFPKLDVDPWEL